MVIAASCGGGSGAQGATLNLTELRRRAADTCGRAATALAELAPPTTFAELDTAATAAAEGVRPALNRLHRLRPPSGRVDEFGDLVEQIDELTFQFSMIQEAAAVEDAHAAADQIAAGQQALDAIDAEATSLDVPDCASGSWGRSYLDAAAAFVATQLPMPTPGTGDFIADATAACGRFYQRFAFLPADFQPPTDEAEYAAFLDSLEEAYEQLLVDLQALTPPPGSERDYADLLELFGLALESVDRAPRDPRRLAELERPLGAIGAELDPRIRVLGFAC